MAGVLTAWGYWREAAQIFGAAEVVFEAAGRLPVAIGKVEYDADLTALRSHLDEPTLEQAMVEGRAMSLDEAIELALQIKVLPERLVEAAKAAPKPQQMTAAPPVENLRTELS